VLPVLFVVPVGPVFLVVPYGPLFFIIPVAFFFIKAVVLLKPLLALVEHFFDICVFVKTISPLLSSLVVIRAVAFHMLHEGPVEILS